jgi:acetyl esterase/lipase
MPMPMLYAISDWDNAYANGPNIPGGERWPAAWVEPARAYREAMLAHGRARLDIAYGPGPRNTFDLFLPEGPPRGLVVFVHGGYWMRLDKSYWSHLAAGAVARGHAVAMPSYTLCPHVRIPEITREIGAAVAQAMGEVAGPVALSGHSAGGQLVTRMVSDTSPLGATQRARIRHVVSLSGLHDLRPLLRTQMNLQLHLDPASAAAESVALLAPIAGARVTAWVGGAERAEFRRQSQLLANVWLGLGAATAYVEAPDRHHFDVIDALADPESALTATLLG